MVSPAGRSVSGSTSMPTPRARRLASTGIEVVPRIAAVARQDDAAARTGSQHGRGKLHGRTDIGSGRGIGRHGRRLGAAGQVGGDIGTAVSPTRPSEGAGRPVQADSPLRQSSSARRGSPPACGSMTSTVSLPCRGSSSGMATMAAATSSRATPRRPRPSGACCTPGNPPARPSRRKNALRPAASQNGLGNQQHGSSEHEPRVRPGPTRLASACGSSPAGVAGAGSAGAALTMRMVRVGPLPMV